MFATLERCNPQGHRLHKIFNWHTLKASYRTLANMSKQTAIQNSIVIKEDQKWSIDAISNRVIQSHPRDIPESFQSLPSHPVFQSMRTDGTYRNTISKLRKVTSRNSWVESRDAIASKNTTTIPSHNSTVFHPSGPATTTAKSLRSPADSQQSTGCVCCPRTSRHSGSGQSSLHSILRHTHGHA